jgi:hypothetical protein
VPVCPQSLKARKWDQNRRPLLGNRYVNTFPLNEYTRNNRRTVRRAVFFAIRVVSITQYVVKVK